MRIKVNGNNLVEQLKLELDRLERYARIVRDAIDVLDTGYRPTDQAVKAAAEVKVAGEPGPAPNPLAVLLIRGKFTRRGLALKLRVNEGTVANWIRRGCKLRSPQVRRLDRVQPGLAEKLIAWSKS